MDVAIDVEKLPGMKYAELRTLAKSVGVKANMKADKLLKALQDYAVKQRQDTGKVATPKPSAPRVASLQQQTTPLQQKRPFSPLSRSPLVKAITPKSSPKIRTPLHRLRTPPSSKRNSPANTSISSSRLTPSVARRSLERRATPTAGSAVSRKRSRSAGGDDDIAGVECEDLVSSAAKRQKRVGGEENEPTAKMNRDSLPKQVTARRGGRSRTSTYDKDEGSANAVAQSSPGTQDLIASMGSAETEEERRANLLAALEKKVQDKQGDGEKPTTQIPRFVAFCALKKQQESENKMTPGQQRYQKAHARNFNKMDSLDQYLDNKKKRTEAILGSAQKHNMAETTSSALKKLKTLTGGSEGATRKTEAKTKLFKTPAHSGVNFTPKVKSVAKVNFNFSNQSPGGRTNVSFSANTKKTPGSASKDTRRSPRLNLSVRDKENAKNTATRGKSMGSSVTPFKFKANLNQSLNSTFNKSLNKSLNKSAVKPKFDLQASLSKPLGYKPHTGKLKPVKTDNLYRKDPKAVKIATKEDRRNQAKANQAQKRTNAQMKRRGLAA